MPGLREQRHPIGHLALAAQDRLVETAAEEDEDCAES